MGLTAKQRRAMFAKMNKYKWTTHGAKYSQLSNKQRRLILDDVGVSKDLNLYGNLPMEVFNEDVQRQIKKQIDKIEDSELRNYGYTH